MKQKINELEINGTIYVPKNSVNTQAINTDGLPLVMIRTYSAGVFYGYLNKKESTLAGMEVELIEARRVWQWSGAASLSQLAMEGTKNLDGCKMPQKVNSIVLIAIEIISMTENAYNSLEEVSIWKK